MRLQGSDSNEVCDHIDKFASLTSGFQNFKIELIIQRGMEYFFSKSIFTVDFKM